MQPRFNIIGLGSWDNGDDSAGLLAALRIRNLDLASVSVRLDTSGGARLLEAMSARSPTIILDAVAASDELLPGRWRRLDYPRDADMLPDLCVGAARHFSLAEILELAGRLQRLPHHTWIYVIAVGRIGKLRAESREMTAAIPGFVRDIVRAVRSHAHPPREVRRGTPADRLVVSPRAAVRPVTPGAAGVGLIPPGSPGSPGLRMPEPAASPL